MRYIAAILLACFVGSVAGQTTQPTTQAVVNGPKIAKELREKIASLETVIASLEEHVKILEQNLALVTKERDALVAEKTATPEGKKEAARQESVAAAIAKHEIVRGMTLDECEKSLGMKGALTGQAEDGSDLYKFVKGTQQQTVRNNRVVTARGTVEWIVWVRNGKVTEYTKQSFGPY